MILEIRVTPLIDKIPTVDRGGMEVRSTFVPKEGGGYKIFRNADIENLEVLKNVKIIRVRRLFRNKEMKIPADVEMGIIHFLRYYHRKQDIEFDCHAFVSQVKGIEEGYFEDQWNLEEKTWRTRRIKVGQVVFLVCEEHGHFHAAIYIGHGLYISVWGAGGGIEFATLEAMKRDFRTPTVYLATPK